MIRCLKTAFKTSKNNLNRLYECNRISAQIWNDCLDDIPIPTKNQGKEKKLTLQELKELTARGDLPTKPASVKIPESVKKYDRIYQTQERTRKLLEDL